jgi:hypothetical protein
MPRARFPHHCRRMTRACRAREPVRSVPPFRYVAVRIAAPDHRPPRGGGPTSITTMARTTCKYPDCEHAAAPAGGTGRPPEYCAGRGHTRVSAWRERRRLAAEQAGTTISPAEDGQPAHRGQGDRDGAAAVAARRIGGTARALWSKASTRVRQHHVHPASAASSGNVAFDAADCRGVVVPACVQATVARGGALEVDRPPDAGCGFHCGGCLTLRCDLTDADVHRSAQRPERRSHLARKEFRLFPGGEVTAPVEFVEVDELGIGPLGPAAR